MTHTRGTLRPGAIAAAPFGWIAIAATILSSIGYAFQILFDHVSVPDDVAELVFFGFFEWDAVLALLAGIVAVWIGRQRNDWTVRFGLIAVFYALLMQLIQSVWD